MAAQVQTSQQLLDHVTQVVNPAPARVIAVGSESMRHPAVHIPKMTMEDHPEIFLHSFELSAREVWWPKNQWAAIVFSCSCEDHISHL